MGPAGIQWYSVSHVGYRSHVVAIKVQKGVWCREFMKVQ